MVPTARPRRSVLYMPGSNARALEKGRSLAADGLILDLEDATAPDKKIEAREMVCQAAASGGFGRREILIRVNGLDTPWGHDDIVAAAASGCDGILLPKVESAGTVRQAEAIMAAAGAPDSQALWCMLETPMGILEASAIAGASARLEGFVMGTSDLAKDLHCAHTRERQPMITALGLCLLAARAHGLAILDGVHLDLTDDEGFAYACRQGREMGFDGKTLIHPKTIETANTVFAPSEDEVAWSRKIIEAHAAAEAEGRNVVLVDGKLVEILHVVAAQRLLATHEGILALEKDLKG